MTASLERSRQEIAERVRELRTTRGWTQKQLAKELGLSQSRLSELERGAGSFTAEQLLRLMATFNVTVTAFTSLPPEDAQLQNLLAQQGAHHLRKSGTLSDTQHQRLPALVDATLKTGEARLVTGLAPVLLQRRRSELHDLARAADNRIWWLFENVSAALRSLRSEEPNLEYARAHGEMDALIRIFGTRPTEGETLLDANVRSVKSIEGLVRSRSEISSKWHIVSALEPADFAEAIVEARRA